MYKIEEKELILDCVICYTVKGNFVKANDLHGVLKKILSKYDVYPTSPGIFRRCFKDGNVIVKFMYALDHMVNIEDENCQMINRIMYDRCLFTRIISGEYPTDEVEEVLRKEAENLNFIPDKEGCIYVYNKIPGGAVLDIYLPVFIQ